MHKMQYRKNYLSRNIAGLSLVELLTCVMIIGIATAGTMELAYINAFSAANGLNKADNLYSARRFLDLLNRDLRNTMSVSEQWTPPNVILTLSRSQDLQHESADANGFPIVLTPVVYTVLPDPNSTDTVSVEYMIQRQESSGSPVTVLTGLVGPVNKSGSPNLGTFQFSSLSNPVVTTDGLGFTASAQTNSVIVNLELKRVNMGSATANMNQNTAHSFEAIRSEIFLRNSALGVGQ